jgi:methyl-accepting chemotaxis protein
MFVATKLKLNIGIVLVGFIVLLFVSYNKISSLQEDYDKYKNINTQMNYLKSILTSGLSVNSATFVYAFDPISDKIILDAQSELENIKEYTLKLSKSFFKKPHIYSEFINYSDSMFKLAKKNQYIDPPTANKLLKVWSPLRLEVLRTIKSLNKEQIKVLNVFKNNLASLFISILIMLSIIALITTVLSLLISKGIVSSLKLLEVSIENLSKGDSVVKIEIENKDETEIIAQHFNTYMNKMQSNIEQDKIVIEEVEKVIEKISVGLFNTKIKGRAHSKSTNTLVEAINKMIDSISLDLKLFCEILIAYGNSEFNHKIEQKKSVTGLVSSVLHGIKATGSTISDVLSLIDNANKQLHYASQELTVTANTLSASSNSQATALEQTAAAVEEVTSTISNNAQNTLKMSSYAKEVTHSVNNGKKLASQTEQSMDSISDEVTSISDAIAVIDQIAFQTNILSLNAAVEAATAGEAGKGFAVVAQEVRNLASRSADAAHQIKVLVQSAKDKALEGKNISSNMIEGYNILNDNITQTIELINEVANSSKEQQEAMIQINDAISSLDQTTQRNAKEASHISKMATNNEKLSENLQAAIDQTSFDKSAKRRVCDIEMIFKTTELKLNHINFKNSAFAQAKPGNNFKVIEHKSCALGKWINENEHRNFAKTKEWEELKIYHKNVHELVQDTVDLEAKSSLNSLVFESTAQIEDNMNKVFETFDKLKEVNCDLKLQKT